ncbi:hypothetical protein CRG98_047039 [Punica granatum]|uniref:Uncharacterized protein n=1 Tax=Punica granatum TaxID=22663 RepID=A0A2I0HMR1_PUNGR|nr:hypothetical protein CRG98_047039 [Punica granatum]
MKKTKYPRGRGRGGGRDKTGGGRDKTERKTTKSSNRRKLLTEPLSLPFPLHLSSNLARLSSSLFPLPSSLSLSLREYPPTLEEHDSFASRDGPIPTITSGLLVNLNLEAPIPNNSQAPPAPLPCDVLLRSQSTENDSAIGRGCSFETLGGGRDPSKTDCKSQTVPLVILPKKLGELSRSEEVDLSTAADEEDDCPICLEAAKIAKGNEDAAALVAVTEAPASPPPRGLPSSMEAAELHHAPTTVLGPIEGDTDYPPVRTLDDAKVICSLESKKLWSIAGPIAFNILCNYGINSFTNIFAGHLGDVELSAVAICLNVIANFSFGFLVRIVVRFTKLLFPIRDRTF